MDISRWLRKSEYEWRIEPRGAMRVPGVLFADETLIREMDDKVLEQVANVATLPGIVKASFAMPDAHWGYGFPDRRRGRVRRGPGRRGFRRRRRLRYFLRRADLTPA